MDFVEVALMVICFLAPFIVFKMWVWLSFVVGMLILFGIYEWYYAIWHAKKRTLTRHFREFKKKNPKKAWLTVGSLLLGWIILLIHLMR